MVRRRTGNGELQLQHSMDCVLELGDGFRFWLLLSTVSEQHSAYSDYTAQYSTAIQHTSVLFQIQIQISTASCQQRCAGSCLCCLSPLRVLSDDWERRQDWTQDSSNERSDSEFSCTSQGVFGVQQFLAGFSLDCGSTTHLYCELALISARLLCSASANETTRCSMVRRLETRHSCVWTVDERGCNYDCTPPHAEPSETAGMQHSRFKQGSKPLGSAVLRA